MRIFFSPIFPQIPAIGAVWSQWYRVEKLVSGELGWWNTHRCGNSSQHNWFTGTPTQHPPPHTHMYEHTHVHTHINVHLHTPTFTYHLNTYECTPRHIHAYSPTNTHAHTLIHTRGGALRGAPFILNLSRPGSSPSLDAFNFNKIKGKDVVAASHPSDLWAVDRTFV